MQCKTPEIDAYCMNSRETYARFARYYDLYSGNYSADLPLYRSLCTPGGRVLEIGCGTGRVLKALLETGTQVTGVDISAEMLEVARAKLGDYLDSGPLRLLDHDFRARPLDETFNHIFVTFYTFNYLLATDDQPNFLSNVRKSLSPHGMLLLDLFYPQPLAQPESDNWWTESLLDDGSTTVLLRQKRSMKGAIEERVQIYHKGADRDEIVTLRRFVSKQEMASLLREAGFTNVRVANGYTLDSLHCVAAAETTESSFICTATE
jgi:SAM-dependent methyltransferase